MKILLFLASLTYISVVLAYFGDLRLTGSNNRLEFQVSDGTWGTVCSGRGFVFYDADIACKELGYDGYSSYGEEYSYSYYNPPVICEIYCDSDESSLSACHLTMCYDDNYDDYGCSYIITLDCYNSSNDYSDSSSVSGVIIGAVIGVVFLFGLVFFIVACRIYIRHSYARRNENRRVIVTQRRTPRILVARVTRTVSSGPPLPPAYTPSAPNAGYTPVPPRGYQSIPTTDYGTVNPTNNSSVASGDIPSDPPPAYIPAVPPNSSQ